MDLAQLLAGVLLGVEHLLGLKAHIGERGGHRIESDAAAEIHVAGGFRGGRQAREIAVHDDALDDRCGVGGWQRCDVAHGGSYLRRMVNCSAPGLLISAPRTVMPDLMSASSARLSSFAGGCTR